MCFLALTAPHTKQAAVINNVFFSYFSLSEFAIPWNYYGPHTSMSAFAAQEVPR